jgi:hypothetical protein
VIAALAYALRRTSARVVLAFAIGGLVWVGYRALRVEGPVSCPALGAGGSGISFCSTPTASRWDLAVGASVVVVALVVAAALWWERPVRR